MPRQFAASAHAACDKSASSGIAECVIEQMAKAGASADVVEVIRGRDTFSGYLERLEFADK